MRLNFVDGGGDQRLEAAGGEDDDPETLEAERAMRGRRGLEKVSKYFPMSIYIARPYRCDQVEQLGGTEMQNCIQLLQRPNGSNWLHRDRKPRST